MTDERPESLQEQVVAREAHRKLIIAAYEAATWGWLSKVLLLDYRCERGDCLLFHAWQSPDGVLFYQRGYKLSPERNAVESTASGRRAHTRDGRRRWQPNAGKLSENRGLRLQCDHVKVERLDDALVRADLATARPGRPTHRVF